MRPSRPGRPAVMPGQAAEPPLHLHGGRTYACRRCRGDVRVVSARYLPDTCPLCGASTWTRGGSCAGPAVCSGERGLGHRGRAFCHRCGHSIWVRAGEGRPDPPPPTD